MRSLFGLLMAALLLLLPQQPVQAAQTKEAPASSLPPNLEGTYALAIDGLNTRNGGVLDPDFMRQLRVCPICPNGRVVCPPKTCK